MVERKHVEEMHLRRGDMDLRFIINHSHGHLRFMDYRVGSYQEKRDALDELAARLRLRKVFTLVEKQDSHNWRSVGFVREGVYPAFFRTADAYTMSRPFRRAGRSGRAATSSPAFRGASCGNLRGSVSISWRTRAPAAA